jgi:hypothetical protein
MSDTQALGRILAIEPDPRRGAVLCRVLDRQVCAGMTVVADVDAALVSIANHVPDLILTSTFLAPADLARVLDDLRGRRDAAHTQVITTPHFPDEPDGDVLYDDSGRVVQYRSRRTDAGASSDPVILRTEVAQYLQQARLLRVSARNTNEQGVPASLPRAAARASDLPAAATLSTALVVPTAREVRAANSVLRPADRRRASRHRPVDLAGQWAVRLQGGGEASLVDISRAGVRLETSTRLNPGRLISLEVVGVESTVAVEARLIRSEVVETGNEQVKYRAAAMFLREIDLFATNGNLRTDGARASSYAPGALADLLGRVLANASWTANGAGLRSRFESEVRVLLGANEVRIRDVAAGTAGDGQSLCFAIPAARNRDHSLHVVFEPGHQPTAIEVRLLSAVASLAPVVLELEAVGQAAAVR